MSHRRTVHRRVHRARRSVAVLVTGAAGLAMVSALSGCGHDDHAAAWVSASPVASGATSGSASASASPSGAAPTAVVTVTATRPATAPAQPTQSTQKSGTQATSGPVIRIQNPPNGMVSWSSPTGRIGCDFSVSDGIVRCDATTAHWTLPASTPACDLANGDSAYVGPQGSGFTCHGDTVFGTATVGQYGTGWVNTTPGATVRDVNGNPTAVLAYESTLQLNSHLACTSHDWGMICQDSTSGHGFLVSIQKGEIH